MVSKKCQQCHQQMDVELSANFIVFCPNCHQLVYQECEYGYGPVVPCKILLGSKEIARVTCQQAAVPFYRYDSEVFSVHKRLTKSYLEALEEAKAFTAFLLR